MKIILQEDTSNKVEVVPETPLLESLKTALDRVLPPKTKVTVNGKSGEVDRVESDGTVHVWFGKIREQDGARITQAVHFADLDE